MAQVVIVYLIVAAAAAYAAWKLLPRALGRRVLRAGLAILRRAGVHAQRVDAWERQASGAACGACDSCGGCSEAAPSPSAPAGERTITLRVIETR